MLIVVDANSLFAASIKGGPSGEMFFSEKLELVTPEFILEEFVPLEELKEFRDRAESVCPDPKDIPYFALALKLGCPIWSNERKLKEGQSVVNVFSTEDLLEFIK